MFDIRSLTKQAPFQSSPSQFLSPETILQGLKLSSLNIRQPSTSETLQMPCVHSIFELAAFGQSILRSITTRRKSLQAFWSISQSAKLKPPPRHLWIFSALFNGHCRCQESSHWRSRRCWRRILHQKSINRYAIKGVDVRKWSWSSLGATMHCREFQ